MRRATGAALFAVFILTFTVGTDASALEIQETFSTRSRFGNTGTAVWNQTLGMVHPSLFVLNYNGAATQAVDVGDGSDGAFEPATYANFGTVVVFGAGLKITMSTVVHPQLQVTRFELAQNDVLEITGGNPLIIKSLSSVDVQGDIWCHGEPGLPSVGAAGGDGGIGRCGGGNGGDGGDAGQPGANGGSDSDPRVTGGRGGDYRVASFVGGGGGGSWSMALPPTPGVNSSILGGKAGDFFSEPEFFTLEGSGGGGGGSGSVGRGGGGGGGAGGLVVIHAVGDFNLGDPGQAYGFIFANGGNGGNADLAGPDAGPGGGGGGGSVQIFVGGTLNLFNNSGAGGSQANEGVGGTNFGGTNGGDGGLGRSWLTAVFFGGGGVYFPPEELTPGDVNFETASQFVESRSIDLMNASGAMNSALLAPASAEYTISLAGSDDNFASDNTGWTTNLSAVQSKRYIKFRIDITNTDPINPSMVNTATLDYDWGMREDFEFRAGSCGRIENASPPGGNWLLFALPFLIYGILKFKTYRSLRRH